MMVDLCLTYDSGSVSDCGMAVIHQIYTVTSVRFNDTLDLNTFSWRTIFGNKQHGRHEISQSLVDVKCY